MKLGEKLMFGFAGVLSVAGVARGIQVIQSDEPARVRDYYEWTETALKGHELYRRSGCNSCHRALNTGEIGVAPVLDGTGTRRSVEWIGDYLTDPLSLVPGSAHDGSLGPDFRTLDAAERELLSAFLFALKSAPGSRNYPVPPQRLSKSGLEQE